MTIPIIISPPPPILNPALLSIIQPADTFPSSVVTSGDTSQTFISTTPTVTTSTSETSSIDVSLFVPLGPIATDIGQMYNVSPEPSSVQWQYNVGESPINDSIMYTFENLTIGTSLQFLFTYADFLQIDTPDNIVILAPQNKFMITVSLNESDAKNKSVQNIKNVSNMLSWTTTPLNITGPVYLAGAPPKINN